MEAMKPTEGATWADWMENAEAAASAIDGFIVTWGDIGLWGAAAAGLLTILTIASRTLPGVYGWGANLLRGLMASRVEKKRIAEAEVKAKAAEDMVIAIQDWAESPNEKDDDMVVELKKRISQLTPTAFDEIVRKLKLERERNILPPVE